MRVAFAARPVPGRPSSPRRVGWLTGIAVLLLALSGCTQPPTALEKIRKRGELRVVTLNLPTCYYLGAQGPEGLEFELAREFASQLGVTLVIYPVASEHAMQTEIARGRADIAAAQITADPGWSLAGAPAPPYARVPQLVVYRRDGVRPRGTLQFESAKLAVRAASPQERILEQLQRTVEPSLHWVETAPTSADPLEDVDSGDADYAIIDAREYSYAHHLYPDIEVGFALPQDRPVQWIVRPGAPDLLEAVQRFFHTLQESGKVVHLMQQATGDTREFAYEESVEFQSHLADRLPRYRAWFEQAGARSGLDWRLLAAIGYQESKWDPVAQSGYATGLMMLTADTAQAMGIRDRNDPQQNIFAGARYLASVRTKIPARIPEPDRTWFMVAAYNVGFGHLEDARVLTQSLGGNPDSWADVRRQLPHLAEERFYRRAKRGYARGWEPVQFVDRVQRYLTLLEWQPGQNITSQVTRIEAIPSG